MRSQVIEDALEKYNDQQLAICFNGGKDCTVLLHLVYAVFCKKLGKKEEVKLQSFCIRIDDPFPEMETFLLETKER